MDMNDAMPSDEKKEDAPVEMMTGNTTGGNSIEEMEQVAASAGESTPLTQEGGSPTLQEVLTEEGWSLVCSFLGVESTINALCVSKGIMKLLGSWEGPLFDNLRTLILDMEMKLEIRFDMEYTMEGSCMLGVYGQ